MPIIGNPTEDSIGSLNLKNGINSSYQPGAMYFHDRESPVHYSISEEIDKGGVEEFSLQFTLTIFTPIGSL